MTDELEGIWKKESWPSLGTVQVFSWRN